MVRHHTEVVNIFELLPSLEPFYLLYSVCDCFAPEAATTDMALVGVGEPSEEPIPIILGGWRSTRLVSQGG